MNKQLALTLYRMSFGLTLEALRMLSLCCTGLWPSVLQVSACDLLPRFVTLNFQMHFDSAKWAPRSSDGASGGSEKMDVPKPMASSGMEIV